jgi:hypothetical protein
MASAGFLYDDPVSAFQNPEWFSSPHISSLQLLTSQADIKCKLKTNLVGVDQAAQRSSDDAYIAKNHENLVMRMTSIRSFIAAQQK